MFATQELDKRKQKILDALVRNYIHTAEPVGSLTLWENYIHAFSPATIRNEMADLEEAGYIEQPHTSSGRVPTDHGYRFYVDHLMRTRELTAAEEEAMDRELELDSLEAEDILHQTARILSHTLEYAAIVVNLDSHRKVFSAGASRILHQPEFKSIDQARRILDLMDEESILEEMVSGYIHSEEITIKIGSENKYRQAKDCSVVVASYELGKEKGGIQIIGPTRMFYGRVLRVVKYVVKALKRVGEKL